MVLKHSHYPPILQSNSWTMAIPFKEQRHHHTPSESIANNYSPRAQELKIRELLQRRHAPPQSMTKSGKACILSCFLYWKPWSLESFLRLLCDDNISANLDTDACVNLSGSAFDLNEHVSIHPAWEETSNYTKEKVVTPLQLLFLKKSCSFSLAT